MSTDTLDFSNLEKNSLQMLQKFAKESLHIRSVTTYRKPQLIELIQKKLQTESQQQQKEAAQANIRQERDAEPQRRQRDMDEARQQRDMDDTCQQRDVNDVRSSREYDDVRPTRDYDDVRSPRDYDDMRNISDNTMPEQRPYNQPYNSYSSEPKDNDYRMRQNRDWPQTQGTYGRYKPRNTDRGNAPSMYNPQERTTVKADGILEIMPDGFGFLRAQNCYTSDKDVYVSANFIKRVGLRSGDHITGLSQIIRTNEKFPSLFQIDIINGRRLDECRRRPNFDSLTPIYPDSRITLEISDTENELSTRIIDLISPIGKGQRGLIVSPPKAGKTTLLKQIANGITKNHPDIKLIILLIDERPEEVTDIQRSTNANVIFSTFDEHPEHHAKVAEMILEHSKRLVESGDDVVILLDSITRLARSYNLIVPASGRALSGGLDPTALFKPKKFFGAARNIENGGSLTIIATALIETGSKMDDVIFEEFKGTGNMEIHLNRKLSERRIFPAFDLNKSGTRHDDLLLSKSEFAAMQTMRRNLAEGKTDKVTELIINGLAKTKNNTQFISILNDALAEAEKASSTLDDDAILGNSFA